MKKSFFLFFVFSLIISGFTINQAVSKDTKQKKYVKVVYFHGDYRCATCKKLEAYTEETVNKYFVNEIKSRNVVWTAINFDKDENEHYVDEFKLYNQALIIMKYENGKLKEWKNLPKIWEYVSNKSEYFKYVKKEIEEYQKG